MQVRAVTRRRLWEGRLYYNVYTPTLICITIVYMRTEPHPIRVDAEVWEAMNALPGSTINDKLRGLLFDTKPADVVTAPALLETLELVRQLPDAEDIEQIVDAVMTRKIAERQAMRPAPANGFDPRTIPGVQVGAGRRETGQERAEREERERLARVQALDPVDDPSIDRSGEFCSG